MGTVIYGIKNQEVIGVAFTAGSGPATCVSKGWLE